MKCKIPFILLMVFYFGETKAQKTADQSYDTKKTLVAPEVDGILNDSAWLNVPVTSGFVQTLPMEGAEPNQKTEVKIIYDNSALYIGVMLYDAEPEKILSELGSRDQDGLNADRFYFLIDPYNLRQDYYEFDVYASGVQVDLKLSDATYNAVWLSAAKITKDGWCVEMKIPYSAIRFPKKSHQEWAVQMVRYVRRTRETSKWTLVPAGTANPQKLWKILEGIENIQPPLRLSFTPYLSAYSEKAPLYSSDGTYEYANTLSYNVGADVKYGIDERFTLDMSLLPDFGQVQSDNKIKNLGYEETTYDEKRPFFKEATELFTRNNLFYSRRIGKTPGGFDDVEDSLRTGEVILENPSQTKLINAIKLSGRGDNGLAVGVFNAITNNMYAVLKDSAGNERKLLTEPLTNYNAIVLDKQFKHNSSVYFMNTNVIREGDFPSVNISSTGFVLTDKKSKFSIEANGALTKKYARSDSLSETFQNQLGYWYYIGVDKLGGNFQYGINRSAMNNAYDSRDMGYYEINDQVKYNIYIGHLKFKPYKVFRDWENWFNILYNTNFTTGKRTYFEMKLELYTTLMNYLSVFGGGGVTPLRSFDYDEPRHEGRYYESLRYFYYYAGISSDYRKKLAVDMTLNYANFIDRYTFPGYGGNITPRFRVNDHLTFKYKFAYDYDPYNIGWVDEIDSSSAIIFGGRILRTFENVLTGMYIFNKDMSLSLNARHYWRTGNYRQYFDLEDDGEIVEMDHYHENNNFNYNVFNIDLVYQWQFAPGSNLVLVYKNAIENEDQELIRHFDRNLSHTMELPQSNSISLKVLYYLDYLSLRKNRKHAG